MADHENDQRAECPSCRRRTLLRAVIDEARGILGGQSLSRDRAEFEICPICGWNDLADRQGTRQGGPGRA